jgi:hypothetical protein
VIAHEFAHTLGLGDEYGAAHAYSSPSASTAQQTDADNAYFNVVGKVNLQSQGMSNVVVGGETKEVLSDPLKIKWNLHRIEVSSIIESQPLIQGGRIYLNIAKNQINKWVKLKAENPGSVVYLRQRIAKGNKTSSALVLDNVDISTNKISVTGNLSQLELTYFIKGSLLYKPELDSAGNNKVLIESIVMDYMKNKSFKLTSDYPNCTLQDVLDFIDNKGVPREISQGLGAKYDKFILGLYEGAATFNCYVYRPSLDSKLGFAFYRNDLPIAVDEDDEPISQYEGSQNEKTAYFEPEHKPFNFVSQYFIVDAIDPSKHDELNIDYNKVTKTLPFHKPIKK